MESGVLKSDGEEMGREVVEVGREAHETRGEVWQPCEGIGVGSGWDGPKAKGGGKHGQQRMGEW